MLTNNNSQRIAVADLQAPAKVLTEAEATMVIGGGFWSDIKDAASTVYKDAKDVVKSTYKEVRDWVKDDGVTILKVAAIASIATFLGSKTNQTSH